MNNNDPITKIEAMIKTHGYKGISIEKGNNDLFTILSYNDIPGIIYQFVCENYHPISYGAGSLSFYEFEPIGIEIHTDTLKQNRNLKSFDVF